MDLEGGIWIGIDGDMDEMDDTELEGTTVEVLVKWTLEEMDDDDNEDNNVEENGGGSTSHPSGCRMRKKAKIETR